MFMLLMLWAVLGINVKYCMLLLVLMCTRTENAIILFINIFLFKVSVVVASFQ